MNASNSGSSVRSTCGASTGSAADAAPARARPDSVAANNLRMAVLSTRDGRGGALEHGLDREAGLDARHAGNSREHVEHEALVARQVGHDDAQHVVRLARHEV